MISSMRSVDDEESANHTNKKSILDKDMYFTAGISLGLLFFYLATHFSTNQLINPTLQSSINPNTAQATNILSIQSNGFALTGIILFLSNNLNIIIISLVSLISLRFYYQICWRPMEFERFLTPSERSYALQRSYNDLLPSYPNSWYKFTDSFRLAKNQSFSFPLFGSILTVQRRSDGSISSAVDTNNREYRTVELNRLIYVWFHSDSNPPAWEIPIIQQADDDNTNIDHINNNNKGINTWIYHGDYSTILHYLLGCLIE
jgi:hypothetical protein